MESPLHRLRKFMNMEEDIKITAKSMARALAKAKQMCGDDVYIIQQDEQPGLATLIIRPHVRKKIENLSAGSSLAVAHEHFPREYIKPFSKNTIQAQKPLSSKEASTCLIDDTFITDGNAALILKQEQDALKKCLEELDQMTMGQKNLNTKTKLGKENSNPKFDENIPITRQHLDQSSSIVIEDYFQKPLEAIHTLCDIAEIHHLGKPLTTRWLSEMDPYMMTNPIRLSSGLNNCIPTYSNWLHDLTKKKYVVFLGPPGAGKTSTIAKVAAMIMDNFNTHKIQIASLDTLKRAGSIQLQEYVKPLGLSVVLEEKSMIFSAPDQTFLIDTPALNIYDPEDKKFIEMLKKKFDPHFVLVVPAEINPVEAEQIGILYQMFGVHAMIGTRLDLTPYRGALLRISFLGIPLAMCSKSPLLADGLEFANIKNLTQELFKGCKTL